MSLQFKSAKKEYMFAGDVMALTALENFVPIHRYPAEFDLDNKEAGLIGELDSQGKIIGVKKRIFYKVRP